MAGLIWSINGTSLELSVSEAARVAQLIAVMLLCAHLFLVSVAPVYVADAVSRIRMQNARVSMATELGSNEIVLKSARLANMGLMLLTGLPVLALLATGGG